ncbi:hypothetical protein NL676_027721 [Syzygium grande]|nr:hypothetical protein NL676_027721 [Syzygium grande]
MRKPTSLSLPRSPIASRVVSHARAAHATHADFGDSPNGSPDGVQVHPPRPDDLAAQCTWSCRREMLGAPTSKPSSLFASFSGHLQRRSSAAAASGRRRPPSFAAMSTVATEKEAAPNRKEPGGKPLQVAKRLEKFKTTIFTQMNLNSAIAARFKKDTGLLVDPETEVTVTSGCTEAIAATILGLINPGDEVILFAPFYDSYEATLSMAGADIKCITLRPPDFAVPINELRSAISKKTRAILMNTPHNPTGKMFTREELNVIASLCIENDVLVFSDEVYDKLAFEMDHISIASLPGMYDRTVTMNSLGKTFSLTGWKIGWAISPPHLTWGVRQAHSFLTFATSTPAQWAAAAALRAPDSYYVELRRDYAAKKQILVEGLKEAGFKVFPSSGTYFVVVDHTPFGLENDVAFCEFLIKEVGVVAIPTSVFYLNPEEGKNIVRFTFCKDEGTLRSAVERMKEKLKKT